MTDRKWLPCPTCYGARVEHNDHRIRCSRCMGEGVIQADDRTPRPTAPWGWTVQPRHFWS